MRSESPALGATSGTDGAFALGPLVPSRLELVAVGSTPAGELARSRVARAEAGDEDVALVLGSATPLRVRVVGPGGALDPEQGPVELMLARGDGRARILRESAASVCRSRAAARYSGR